MYNKFTIRLELKRIKISQVEKSGLRCDRNTTACSTCEPHFQSYVEPQKSLKVRNIMSPNLTSVSNIHTIFWTYGSHVVLSVDMRRPHTGLIFNIRIVYQSYIDGISTIVVFRSWHKTNIQTVCPAYEPYVQHTDHTRWSYVETNKNL